MNRPREQAILKQALLALRDHGVTADLVERPAAKARTDVDAWLRAGKGDQQTDYAVEIKRHVTPATLGAVVAQLRHVAAAENRVPLLITDYLTPPMAEKLREHNQQFADTVGNAYVDGPNALVYVVGRKHTAKQATPRGDKAFATAGLKILFALMCNPTLEDQPYRTIAAAAAVALGAVPNVFADLGKAGVLVVAGDRRRLFATRRLLDEWALVYARTLRAKTLTNTYVTAGFTAWREWPIQAPEQRWGGEPAANLLVRHLRPGVLTIYTEKLTPRLAVEQKLTLAGPNDRDHLLEVRRPFWGRPLKIEERDTVPPALVYADLLATGDARCIETAQLVYERYLARFFPAA